MRIRISEAVLAALSAVAVATARRLLLEDSTVSGNDGSGIYAWLASVGIKRSTAAANAGYGIFGFSSNRGINARRSTIKLASSILADNFAGSGPDCGVSSSVVSTRVTSRGFNLIEDCEEIEPRGGDVVGVDPALDPLQDNGGPTETHALQAASPALNAIFRPSLCRRPDQRGVERWPAPCDIGAFDSP